MKGQTLRNDSAESAYKAMCSLFFCIRIKFSDRRNAMYGQKDLFCHLVAMRGKHGYAVGVSHAEDVDRSKSEAASHLVGSDNMRAGFTLIVRPAEDGDDTRETVTDSSKGKSAYHVFATSVPPGAFMPDPDRLSRCTGGAERE